jgi:D-arabinose 1-dehydrogenase-like Zn-dependent alcohol dehydrogenase
MRSRAAILYEYGGPWSVDEFELDPPRAGEVLVQLAATGLCHSDEHIRQGRLAPPPDVVRSLGLPAMSMIGGHQGSGVVVEVGEGVTRIAPGAVAQSTRAPKRYAMSSPRLSRMPWCTGCSLPTSARVPRWRPSVR